MESSVNTCFSREIIENIYGIPFTEGNRVSLLWKGHELFDKIFEAVNSAENLICLEFYIFRNDETGTELAKILKRKASEGIKVYILYDHFGSFGTPRKFWNDLKDAGVQVKASRPFKWTKPLHYIHRDHKKLIIIDGRIAFTGGLNIANEYRGFHRFRKVHGWRDTGIFLEGPIANILFEIFKKNWQIWKGEPINFQAKSCSFNDGIPVIPIFASSSKSRKKMRKLLYYSISNAKESIYLTTAYFTPSIRMINVLEDAIKRGVNVNILLPSKSDVISAHYAGRAFFTTLLKAGVRIFNYKGEMLHAKTSVFDCNWSIIGSANLDFQSMRRNDEGNVGILDNNFGGKMLDVFNEDLKNSEEILLQNWMKRPFLEKLKESFFVLFRKRL